MQRKQTLELWHHKNKTNENQLSLLTVNFQSNYFINYFIKTINTKYLFCEAYLKIKGSFKSLPLLQGVKSTFAISFTVRVLPVRKKVSEKIRGFPNIQLMLSLKFQPITYSGRVLLTPLTVVSFLIFAEKFSRFPGAVIPMCSWIWSSLTIESRGPSDKQDKHVCYFYQYLLILIIYNRIIV